MPLTTHTATARLSREIPDAEAAADQAAERIAAVIVTSMAARRDTGVRNVKGHSAILRLHRALGGMIDAQGELLRAHGKMLEIGVETGTMEEPTCPDRPLGMNDAQIGHLLSA